MDDLFYDDDPVAIACALTAFHTLRSQGLDDVADWATRVIASEQRLLRKCDEQQAEIAALRREAAKLKGVI